MNPAVVPASRRTTFRRVRIAILLAILIVTAAWGASTAYKRAIRGRWQRPLQVGIVLLAPGAGVNEDRWRQGASRLSDRLAEEMQRWRGPGANPFDVSVVGPVAWNRPLPFTPASGSLVDRARHALDVWRTVREIDRAAGGVADRASERILG